MRIGGLEVIDARGRYPDMPNSYNFPQRPVPVARISIHHDGMAFTSLSEQMEENRLGATYDWHRNKHGWSGIGYTLYVFPSSRIYLVGDLNTQRAAVADQNKDMVGICLAGDFRTTPPPEAQLAAMQELITALCNHYRKRLDVKPHFHWGGTTCPGMNSWDSWWHRTLPLWQVPQQVDLETTMASMRNLLAGLELIKTDMNRLYGKLIDYKMLAEAIYLILS